MSRIDPFTLRRLIKFLEDHRQQSGQLPTLQDFERGGFPRETVEAAEKQEAIEKYYVTLTNGTIVKGYKIKSG